MCDIHALKHIHCSKLSLQVGRDRKEQRKKEKKKKKEKRVSESRVSQKLLSLSLSLSLSTFPRLLFPSFPALYKG
jgi:hypothetical protein